MHESYRGGRGEGVINVVQRSKATRKRISFREKESREVFTSGEREKGKANRFRARTHATELENVERRGEERGGESARQGNITVYNCFSA